METSRSWLTAAAFVALVAACSNPAPAPEPAPAAPTEPPEAELVERGKYLVEIMGCHDCHSPKLMGPQGPYPDPDRLLSGHPAGTQLPPLPNDNAGWALMSMDLTAAVGPWGTSFAANLTSDDSGIGTWTEEQFKRAITKGLYKGLEGSRPLLPPMPWQNLQNLKEEDIHAIFSYLKSTKPVANVVPPPVPPSAPPPGA
ncbi:MAG TPA: c-type cytochrome [Flavobacteriales bacterium]|nr:c-type cytochrome [Flavobacteriales bacterium]HMR29090.1 c-type cytochrome [Flavobacteriales bacterium]